MDFSIARLHTEYYNLPCGFSVFGVCFFMFSIFCSLEEKNLISKKKKTTQKATAKPAHGNQTKNPTKAITTDTWILI